MTSETTVDVLPIFRIAEMIRYCGEALDYVKTPNPKWTRRVNEKEPRYFHRNAWAGEIQGIAMGFEITDHFVNDIITFYVAPGERAPRWGLRPNTINERVYELIAANWSLHWDSRKITGYPATDNLPSDQRGTQFMNQRMYIRGITLWGDYEVFKREMTMLLIMHDFAGASVEMNRTPWNDDKPPQHIRIPLVVNP